MALIVQKYGGTSVGSPEKIKAVAERVLGYSKNGHKMVIVLSAMSGETDRLISLANSVQEQPDTREMDVLLSTGEQVTISLFAMAIKAAGYEAVSLLGDQVRILTSSMHTKARIESVDTERIQNHLLQTSAKYLPMLKEFSPLIPMSVLLHAKLNASLMTRCLNWQALVPRCLIYDQ
jgi:aspartate kinase